MDLEPKPRSPNSGCRYLGVSKVELEGLGTKMLQCRTLLVLCYELEPGNPDQTEENLDWMFIG